MLDQFGVSLLSGNCDALLAYFQTATATPLSTPQLLSRCDSSAHDLTQFAAHAVAYERKLASTQESANYVKVSDCTEDSHVNI